MRFGVVTETFQRNVPKVPTKHSRDDPGIFRAVREVVSLMIFVWNSKIYF